MPDPSHISVFDIFKVGIGPSSSHTVGPMRAARRFIEEIEGAGQLEQVHQVYAQLYGSLAMTGKGHCTDRAILLGLSGQRPESVQPETIEEIVRSVRTRGEILLLGRHRIGFDEPMNLLFLQGQILPRHPNGMRFSALDANENVLLASEYFSVGGGFVVGGGAIADLDDTPTPVPYPYTSARELTRLAREAGLQWHELILANECAQRSEADVRRGLADIWSVMSRCIDRGLQAEGELPGGLRVQRRAAAMHRELRESAAPVGFEAMEWVNNWAMAVNEENAAGGQVVTAPTNGAAGVIPAVLKYYGKFAPGADMAGVERFLLTAGSIGTLYKKNASISGAEMGCQGEVGVACSMAAGGLVAAIGGSNGRIENAAEIGMEHNLGLTCDPVAGLVQIPCIERNAMGAVKAINAALIAMRGGGTQKVSLDQIIETMRQTGNDMSAVYKETSRGGLAVNVIEC